jgi:hypothetical protein
VVQVRALRMSWLLLGSCVDGWGGNGGGGWCGGADVVVVVVRALRGNKQTRLGVQ